MTGVSQDDYSQSGEQLVITEIFNGHDLAHGRLLDIGAYHPKVFSNSRKLIELGWEAVMIEAAPGPMRSLLEEYGKDEQVTLIQAAAGLENGLVELTVSDDAVSSSDPAHVQTWREEGGFLGKVLVPAITLGEIFNRYGGDWRFVNIDIEGKSSDLFLALLASGCRPKCICCEVDPNRLNEMMTAASQAGYSGKVVGGNLITWL